MQQFNLNNDFEPCYFIKKPDKGRRLVITDIHGHFYTFIELLKKVEFNKNDQLFLTGDMIDRGKHCQLVLDWIIDRLNSGFQIYPSRGNHEEMAWEAHFKNYTEEELQLPRNRWGKNIVNEKREIFPQYIDIISKLPYYYELDRFYLVHAGFNFNSENPFKDYKHMVWHPNHEVPENFPADKKIIHGHSMRPIEEIQEQIKENRPIIFLDNGVFTTKKKDYGRLLCLDLDRLELWWQVGSD